MKTKLIFLDFDGVLNSVQYVVSRPKNEMRLHEVDTTCIGLLRFLCKVTEAQIVVSSTWRHGRTKEWFIGYFEALGWAMPPIVGVTPVIGGKRGDEVIHYLCNFPQFEGGPTPHVILDDDSDFHPDQPLIHCDNMVGLTIYNVMDAIDILGVTKDNEERVNSLRKQVNFKRSKI